MKAVFDEHLITVNKNKLCPLKDKTNFIYSKCSFACKLIDGQSINGIDSVPKK